MPKARIRNGELRIPLSDEIREKLEVQDGDELDAHVFKGSVTFTPASSDLRERAWQRIFAFIDRVHVRAGLPEASPEEVEEMIDEEVRSIRCAPRGRQEHD